MIVFKRYGHTFKIRDDDWKGFRERYDVKNADETDSGNWKIFEDCAVCERHDKCEDCPFGCLGEHGCFAFFEKMFRELKFDSSNMSYVSWSKGSNSSARRQLKRIQKIMDKIEEENKK